MKIWLPGCIFLAQSMFNLLKDEFPTLPGRAQYVPDIVTAAIGAIVIARIVLLGRMRSFPVSYWLVFFGFVYIVVCGSVLNKLSPDVAFAGIRFYFRYVPIFLLPFAFDYSERDIKRLFAVVMVLAFVQIPLALRQRFFSHVDLLSGDVVRGTTSSSGGLAVLGVTLVLVVLAYFLDGRMTSRRAALLSLSFLAPPSLAEVKIVPIFLTIGGLAVLFSRRNSLSMLRIVGVASGGVILLTLFILVYDSLYAKPGGDSYIDRMTSEDRVLDKYLLKGIDALPFNDVIENKDLVAKPIRYKTQDRRVGRFDSIRMPFSSLLPSEGMKLALGVGIGNTFSTFGDGARYLFVRDALGGGMTSITQLLWETGVLGTLFFVLTITMIGIDSFRLSRGEGFMGTFGAAWFGVTAVVGVELVYHSIIGLPVLASLYFLFSGIVVSNRHTKFSAANAASKSTAQPPKVSGDPSLVLAERKATRP